MASLPRCKAKLVSFRVNARARVRRRKFRRRYQRVSREGCTRVPDGAPLRARPLRFCVARPCLIVPPVSILNTSLSNAEPGPHWETTGEFHLCTRRPSRAPEKFNAALFRRAVFVKAYIRGHTFPRRERSPGSSGRRLRKMFITTDNGEEGREMRSSYNARRSYLLDLS